ncbi:MAG: sulfatase family protein [Actinomycetota bacterium]
MVLFARPLLLVALACVFTFAPALTGTPATGEADRPNVLIIVTDDQRVDTFAAMPRTRAWFERGGTRFPNTFATTPLCCPSRASIMSGRYAHNHDVETNRSAALFDERGTLQRYLQEEGFLTAMVGKYLNGWQGDPHYFDRWSTFIDPIRYYGAKTNVDGRLQTIKGYSTDYVAREAVSVLSGFERTDTDPWYLYVAPLAPHDPYEPKRSYRRDKVGGWGGNPAVREQDRSDKPSWVTGMRRQTTLKEGREIRAGQLRTLLSVDDLVERLRRALVSLGEEQDTLAFFISDNGKHWGEHGLGGKQDPYTHSVRIPMYLRWPGHVAQGGDDPRLALNVDVAATVLDATGASADAEHPLDGRSLLAAWDRDHVYSENKFGGQGFPSWSTVRTNSEQYIEWYDEDLETVSFREYYDLTMDPWQLTNLLGDADTSNDPPAHRLTELSLQIARDRRCQGTNGAGACP